MHMHEIVKVGLVVLYIVSALSYIGSIGQQRKAITAEDAMIVVGWQLIIVGLIVKFL